MQKSLVSLLIAAGISMSPVAYAEDAAPQEAPKAEEKAEAPKTEAVAADAKNTEDQAFPVAGETPEVGKEFVADQFDDWQKVCVILEEGKGPSCRLFQLLKDEGGSAVAEISIVALAKAEKAVAGVNFITPLGTLLTAQATMRIDAGKARRYPFSWCDQIGCITRFGLSNAELASLKKGNKAVMTIAAAATGKPVPLNVSLKGFTAAWDSIKPE